MFGTVRDVCFLLDDDARKISMSDIICSIRGYTKSTKHDYIHSEKVETMGKCGEFLMAAADISNSANIFYGGIGGDTHGRPDGNKINRKILVDLIGNIKKLGPYCSRTSNPNFSWR
jgi:hypothetical protein